MTLAALHERQTELDALCGLLWRPENETRRTPQPQQLGQLRDHELLERAMSAKNGPKFTALWKGDRSGYESPSEADMALCDLLAWWADGDADQVDRVFRASGLYREEKWERDTYREPTLAKACEKVRNNGGGYHPTSEAKARARQAQQDFGRNSCSPEQELSGNTRDVVGSAPPAPDLAAVLAGHRRWLHLPDPDPLYGLLATVAANRLPGDPLWLLLVAPPSLGKTELLGAFSALPNVHAVATLTESGLLSGTTRKDRAKDATGGLLRQVGDFGIIVLKDFGSILSMQREQRAGVLAALREIFDGSWQRVVGADGGRVLSWRGKAGLLGGTTATIDRHHSVLSSLGDRFLLLRLGEGDPALQAATALAGAGQEKVMRRELSELVAGFFAGLTCTRQPELPENARGRLIDLALLATRCRSTVERDSYTREIELVNGAEGPARVARQLAQLRAGLLTIGLDEATAWRVLARVALDTVPLIRRQVLVNLTAAHADDWHDTAAVALAASYPTNTAKRALQDLAVYGVVEQQKRPGDGRSLDQWRVSAWTRERWAALSEPSGKVSPEMSEGVLEGATCRP